jgi:hypothetical protein
MVFLPSGNLRVTTEQLHGSSSHLGAHENMVIRHGVSQLRR